MASDTTAQLLFFFSLLWSFGYAKGIQTSVIKLFLNKYFEFKKVMVCRGAPELELLAVVPN